MYELHKDRSGVAYSNILELRRDKMIHWLNEVPRMTGVQYFLPIRYEDAVVHGIASVLIEPLEKALGMKAKCTPSPPNEGGLVHKELTTSSPEYRKWLDDHVDWEAEALGGYTRDLRVRKNET